LTALVISDKTISLMAIVGNNYEKAKHDVYVVCFERFHGGQLLGNEA
jgi:hypothetical protein